MIQGRKAKNKYKRSMRCKSLADIYKYLSVRSLEYATGTCHSLLGFVFKYSRPLPLDSDL
jgi:hypothetical protein